MSAWVVSKTHIDVLVSAALEDAHRHTFRYRASTYPVGAPGVYQAGAPWGPAAVAIAGEHFAKVTFDNADEVGAMLWAENIRSVEFRYDEDDLGKLPGPIDLVEQYAGGAYKLRRYLDLNPLGVLHAISCYEYQSCEHPGWETSDAHAFCQQLERVMVNKLPGLDDMPWGIDATNVHKVCRSPNAVSLFDLARRR